ncbi:MAG TPA: BPSS1780 family membrane protein [Paenalcaligenes sp.]|nr:BPSS1780 family membrane protein [Paenalcaligenes sp.]
MQASILPFQYGWYWIQAGLETFKKQPMALIFWALVTNLLINLSYFIPIVGQIALMVLTPSLTFIVLNASRRILKNERMQLSDWLSPIKQEGVFARLLRLGGVYFFFLFVASVLATTPFLDTISAALPDTGESVDPATLMQAVRTPVMLFLGLYLIVSILFWHAPALVGWHQIPLKQALFYSMVACWRNKLPMIIYGVFWGAIYYLFNILSVTLAGSLGSEFSYFVMTFLSFLVFAVLYASFYPIYKTVFNIQDGIELSVKSS